MQLMRPGSSDLDAEVIPRYGGAVKAALVLLSMERGKALELLKSLAPDDVRTIMKCAQELKKVESREIEAVISEFEEAFNEGVNFVGSAEEVRSLVEEALGSDGARLTLGAPVAVDLPQEPPWASVAELTDDVLKAYVAGQHPQAAAFLLSKLEQERCAEILQALPPETANDLLWRLLTIKELAPSVQRALEDGVRQDLLATSKSGDGAHQLVAGVLNELNQDRSEVAIDYLTKRRPDDARKVRKLLFKFDDLPRLAPKSLATVVERLPVERIVIALRDASPQLQESVLGAMAPRARRMAESELKNDGGTQPKAVAEAKRLIAQAVLNLASTGAIELPGSTDGAP